MEIHQRERDATVDPGPVPLLFRGDGGMQRDPDGPGWDVRVSKNCCVRTTLLKKWWHGSGTPVSPPNIGKQISKVYIANIHFP